MCEIVRHTERGGGVAGDTSPGAPNFFLEKGSHEIFKFLPSWAVSSRCFFIFRFLLHCLDSTSECLGRIISNTFMVNVDKYFDACKHMKPTSLISWPCLLWIINWIKNFVREIFPQGPSALSAALEIVLKSIFAHFLSMVCKVPCGHLVFATQSTLRLSDLN